jgi:lysosomal alpha-mannosidase
VLISSDRLHKLHNQLVKHVQCKCFIEVYLSNLLIKISTCIKAENVQTAIIVFNDWTSQEISLYDEGEFVEVQWTVGPVPINDNIGKEIIIRYDTDIQSQGKYYTDANGREVLERIRDYRPTWNYTVFEPVSGNYYPVTSRIWIKEPNRQFTILTGTNDSSYRSKMK